MTRSAHRRELERRVLETMANMRGSGWVAASDITDRLNPADGLTKRDGRRVAGVLRRLARYGLVDRNDQRDVVSDHRGSRLVGPLLEYRITESGIDWIDQAAVNTPRLTDPIRSWPRRTRVAHRHNGGRP